MPTIQVHDLCKYYIDKKDKSATAVLYKVNGVIPDGSFTVIMGPSGCGKTTLLKCICGLLPVDDGRIYFDGEDMTDAPAGSRNLSYVSQAYALYPHKTVFDNVVYPLQLAGVEDAQIRRRARELMALLGIEGLATRRPRQLSGGQQQRVALARALIKRPGILLLDEPLANIDEKQKRELMDLFLALQQRLGISFVYVTHSIQEAWYLGQQLVVMDNGEIVESGAGRSLLKDPESYVHRNFVATQAIGEAAYERI